MDILHSLLWFLGASAAALGTLALIGGSVAIASLEHDEATSTDGARA